MRIVNIVFAKAQTIVFSRFGVGRDVREKESYVRKEILCWET